MARRRMIEVSISHDKALNRLSDFAQLLYLKILPHTDDWGRFEGDPELVRARVDPLSKKPVAKYESAMAEIAQAGLWLWYETDKGRKVIQYSEAAFERINAFLIKNRKNAEFPPYKDTYKLICNDMECYAGITHIKTKEERLKIKEESKKQKAKRGKPESIEEVRSYLQEIGIENESERFFSYYEANGWVQGRQGKPIVDWRAAARHWKINKEKYSGSNRHGYRQSKAGGETTADDLRRSAEIARRLIAAKKDSEH